MKENKWLYNRKFILAVFFIALVFRIVFVVFFDNGFFRHTSGIEGTSFIFPDEIDYHKIGVNITEGHGAILDEEHVATRPPLYPTFIAGVYMIFGQSPVMVQLMQSALGALAVLVFYYILKKAYSGRIARIGAVIVAVYPFFIFFTGLLLTETLFIFMLLAAMCFLYFSRREKGLPDIIIAGVLLGFCILIRGSFILFPIFLFPFFMICIANKRQAFSRYVMLLVVVLVTISPWWGRNYRVLGHFVPATTQGGASLYEANNPEADGGPMLDRLKVPAKVDEMSEYERDRFMRGMAVDYIASNPSDFFKLALIKFGRFWNPVPNFIGYRKPLYMIVGAVSVLFILISAFVGFYIRRHEWRKNIFLLSPVIYFTLLHMVFIGSVRYRISIMPFVIIFSAIALSKYLPHPEEIKEETK